MLSGRPLRIGGGNILGSFWSLLGPFWGAFSVPFGVFSRRPKFRKWLRKQNPLTKDAKIARGATPASPSGRRAGFPSALETYRKFSGDWELDFRRRFRWFLGRNVGLCSVMCLLLAGSALLFLKLCLDV